MKNVILNLKENEFLVFETNNRGEHLFGVAKFANEILGAEWGVAEGLSGKTYALPIKDFENKTLRPYEIEGAISRFKEFAYNHPELRFYLTRIGSETIGLDINWIKDLFRVVPENVIKPKSW